MIRNDADEEHLQSLLLRFPQFATQQLPIILQPEGDAALSSYPAALEQLAERIHRPFWKNYYVRALPQLHVIVWGRRKLV